LKFFHAKNLPENFEEVSVRKKWLFGNWTLNSSVARGSQMVYFETKNRNFDSFWRVNELFLALATWST
jgi:hypothetical protein